MKAALFWIGMFSLLSVFIYLTMATNPQKMKYQKTPPGDSSQIQEGPRTWNRIYAEFHDSDGHKKTMEIKNKKGYFNEADREAFLEISRTEKPYGNAEVRVIEDSIDLVFGVFLAEEKAGTDPIPIGP